MLLSTRSRARIIRVLTVPGGMFNNRAASRVVNPSSTVACTTARNSGDSEPQRPGEVAVLGPSQHELVDSHVTGWSRSS